MNFRTESDTEVIVHGYEQYGESFVTKLNGMFAIALWDSTKKKMMLARDRMGIKPLYYAVMGDTLLFASEIKSILQAQIERRVDTQSLYTILNLGYVPGESDTTRRYTQATPFELSYLPRRFGHDRHLLGHSRGKRGNR